MLNWRIRHAELYKANRRSEARTSEPVCRAVSASQHLMPARPGDKEIPKPVRNDDRVCAFTLAEVLITLVIIGVIAALTIPNLMQKYQEQATVKKVQKFYSNLSNAYSLAMKENGNIEGWGTTYRDEESAAKVYEILFKPYFKIAKDCGPTNKGNCITNNAYKNLNNTTSSGFGYNVKNYYKITLDDGAAVFFNKYDQNLININYDVNGIKGPNQRGKDFFYFMITRGKIFPIGIPSGNYSFSSYSFNAHCNSTTSDGYGCTAWVIYKGNMDYLHCDGLTWDKHSCKDK